jgi:hypothetical protein
MGLSQLLVINPNTSASVSALLQTHVEAALAAAGAGRVHTRHGARAPYIADEASYQVAGHAALDAWAAALAGPMPAPDAVLIGCFGDPGLWALRESSPAPVLGLAEAAFIEAAAHGRFAVVTGGERWAPMLQRLALQLGRAEALAGIVTVAPAAPTWRPTRRRRSACWPRPASRPWRAGPRWGPGAGRGRPGRDGGRAAARPAAALDRQRRGGRARAGRPGRGRQGRGAAPAWPSAGAGSRPSCWRSARGPAALSRAQPGPAPGLR